MKKIYDTMCNEANKMQEKTHGIETDIKSRYQEFLSYLETSKISTKNLYRRILELDRLEKEGLNKLEELLNSIESFNKTIQ